MSDQHETESLLHEVTDLEDRVRQLRGAATMPGADSGPLLKAALVELDLALAALRTTGTARTSAQARSASADADRRMLRTVFQDAPVPLFLLERDGTVRRVNRQAAALLGSPAGYLTGKPFPVLCDMATRATVGSHIAGVFHSGQRHRARVRFLSKHGPVNVDVTFARLWASGEPEPFVVAVTAPSTREPVAPDAPPEDIGVQDAVAGVVHRMDILAAATGMLLDDESLTESVAARRTARLLASELADWAIVDLDQDGVLRRHVVIGPDDERHAEIARMLEDVHPDPGSLPMSVHESGRPVLQAHIDDVRTLGTAPIGLPVCGLIEASSLICVPLGDGERGLGTLTLTVTGEQGPFELMDLALVERLARNLALVIRAGRRYRRRVEVTERLRAGLVPEDLPSIPGAEIAARYVVSTRDGGHGGDFYDVFPTGTGWGVALGDVCGKGEDATAVNATTRHGIKLLSRWNARPDEVLSMVNETLTGHERFVTAVLACVERRDEGLSVVIGSAGHPPAVLIRRDGRIRALSGGGIPLGLFEDDFEVGVESFDLYPGDTLFLYSDGLVESSDALRDRFGHERLLEILSAHAARPVVEMPLAVEQALTAFCDGDLRDDVSMLALRACGGTGLRPSRNTLSGPTV